jgi:hypothetical protein
MTDQHLDALESDVIPIILKWSRSNAAEIIDRYQQKGGWEGWAQAEILAALDHHGFEPQRLQNRRVLGHPAARATGVPEEPGRDRRKKGRFSD